jgi:hypothetical protein
MILGSSKELLVKLYILLSMDIEHTNSYFLNILILVILFFIKTIDLNSRFHFEVKLVLNTYNKRELKGESENYCGLPQFFVNIINSFFISSNNIIEFSLCSIIVNKSSK